MPKVRQGFRQLGLGLAFQLGMVGVLGMAPKPVHILYSLTFLWPVTCFRITVSDLWGTDLTHPYHGTEQDISEI